MNSNGPMVDPAIAVRNLRLVFSSILMGVLVFAAVAPFIRSRAVAGLVLSRRLAVILVIGSMALTIVLSVVGYMIAHKASRPQSSTAGMQGEPSQTSQAITARLIASAALTEAGAMAGIVVYILVGFLPVLAVAVLAAVLGIALSFPRASLFAAAPVDKNAVTFR